MTAGHGRDQPGGDEEGSVLLARARMREGLEVGLYEAGHGQRLHGTIQSLQPGAIHIWIPHTRYGTELLPPEARGFLTALSYQAADAGMIWPEPRATGTPESAPTGIDLLDYWRSARRSGTAAYTTATSYLQGARAVLAHLPTGLGTRIDTLDVETAITSYSADRLGALAPSSIAQYTSGFRNATRLYLDLLATAAPGAVRTEIDLGDGRTLTVLAPEHLPAPLPAPAVTEPAPEAGEPGGER